MSYIIQVGTEILKILKTNKKTLKFLKLIIKSVTGIFFQYYQYHNKKKLLHVYVYLILKKKMKTMSN